LKRSWVSWYRWQRRSFAALPVRVRKRL